VPAAAKRRRLPRLWLVLALVAALVLAFWAYPVEEQSMWPALADGEWVLVDKLALRLRTARRFELCVFRHATDGVEAFFVKRVVALGGEAVHFAGGDLFVGAPGAEPARVPRPANVIEAAWTPVPPGRAAGAPWSAADFDVAGGRLAFDGPAVTLVPGEGGVVSATLTPGFGPRRDCILDDHRAARSGAPVRGRHAVPDVRVTLGRIGPRGGAFAIDHEIGHGDVRTVRIDEDGLTVSSSSGGPPEIRARFPNVVCEAGLRVETLDGEFRVSVEESGTWRELFRETRDTVRGHERSSLRFEARGGPTTVASLEVARDVHYVWGDSPPHPQVVPPGSVFLVGDNPSVSRDSRDPAFGAIPGRELVGVVRAVVLPRPRIPW
jgi:signal peptidase I